MNSPGNSARLIAETRRLGYRRRMGRGTILLLLGAAFGGPALAGTARCWIDQGAVVAAASFGDIAGDFVVDVGAPTSELHVTAANLDGIVGDSAERPLVFAGRRMPSVRMKVADLDNLPPADTNIAGVIGADVLSRWPLTVQFAPCRLTWGLSRPPRGALRLPVTTSAGVPTVQATVSDGVQSRQGRMIVSTGQTETLVPDAVLTRAPNPRSFAPVRLRAIGVGGRLFEQVPGGVADGSTGSIGTGVWRGWKAIRLDVKRGKLELTPAQQKQ